MRYFLLLVAATLTVVLFFDMVSVQASVSVNTGGTSNGISLAGSQGPLKFHTARVSMSGGSIRIAKAKARFTKRNINLGAQVTSRGTGGDPLSTHADANAVFAGTATYRGPSVDNFMIDLGVKGEVRCKADVDEKFFALASVEVNVIANSVPRFSGIATQDGHGEFEETDDLSGGFQASSNKASIRKTFNVNLGMLSDGQRIPFFFAGTTLVSYGQEVPVSFCASEFFRTATFKPSKGQSGEIDVELGNPVNVVFQDDGNPSAVSGEEILFIESNNTSLLDDIKPGSMRAVFANTQTFELEASQVQDVNNNGVSDVVLTAKDQPFTLASFITGSGINSLYIYGETNNQDAIIGYLDITDF